MIDTIIYNRNSVCQGDDYVNRTIEISLPDDSVLEDLVNKILSTRIDQYSGSNQYHTVHRYSASVHQLRRYIFSGVNGGNGNCSQCLQPNRV